MKKVSKFNSKIDMFTKMSFSAEPQNVMLTKTNYSTEINDSTAWVYDLLVCFSGTDIMLRNELLLNIMNWL